MSPPARSILRVVLFALAVGALPWLLDSDVQLNFVVLALYSASLGLAWNVLGGFGGQYSFGHAMFFGVGAYASAVLQLRLGVDPWVALAAAIALGGLTGLGVGALTFRYGLKGSKFLSKPFAERRLKFLFQSAADDSKMASALI